MTAGRPSDYSQERADEICERLSSGELLIEICKAEGMPNTSTVWRWQQKHEDFRNAYAHARQAGLIRMADEIVSISDDGANDTYLDDDGNEQVKSDVIQRSRLRVDTRKWLLSKLVPMFADKSTVDMNVSGDISSIIEEGRKRAGQSD